MNPGLGIHPDRRPEVRIRMGRKGERGGVIEKDRFHLCSGRASGSGMKAVSDYHPSFGAFNGATPDRRREVRGTIIHSRWEAPARHGDGACWTRFDANKLPGHEQPPGQHPVCSGDGRRAKRWVGRKWTDIVCPGDGCEFRQGDSPPCKRSSTLVVQLRWREEVGDRLPAAAAFIESGGSWSFATHQWWGFYVQIRTQWRRLLNQPCPDCRPTSTAPCRTCEGDRLVGEPDLYGMPIRISLQRRTVPARGAEVWVPELYTDFAAGQTLQGFLAWRAKLAEEARPLLCGAVPLALPGEVMGARGTTMANRDDVQDVEGEPVEPPMRGKR